MSGRAHAPFSAAEELEAALAVRSDGEGCEDPGSADPGSAGWGDGTSVPPYGIRLAHLVLDGHFSPSSLDTRALTG